MTVTHHHSTSGGHGDGHGYGHAGDPGVDEPGAPVLGPGHDYNTVTDQIADVVQNYEITPGWAAGMALAGTFVMILTCTALYLFVKGTGIWGINMPVAWGFAIINFV
ncbi:MAG: hypothetical protein JO353_05755, partial [Phycisphaerae bacterium]|nr:hypothetical protein [Phycisphaerae bacterium]